MAKSVLTLSIGDATGMLRKAIGRMVGKWITQKGVVTLDIDKTTIRLLETKGGVVKKWVSASLESDEVEGGVVSDWQTLGAMVKQLMTSSGMKVGKVIASLSGLYSISRIITVSDMPAGLSTQDAVLDMARTVMPLSMDRLHISWQTITAGEGEWRFFIVGVPQDVIDGEVQSLKAVGINPHILKLKAMALTSAVNKENALILNIEPSSLDIAMVVSGVPEIMRTITWQHEDLTLEDKAEYLAITLETTVDFYNSRNPGAPLDPAAPLFITGQYSEDTTLMEELKARLSYPIEPLAPPLEYPADMPISQYAVNIGLALERTVPSENLEQGGYVPLDINLLPEIYRPWKPTVKQLYAIAFIIAAMALLFPLYQVTTKAMAETANLQTKFDAVNSVLAERQAEIKSREPLQKTISEYRTIVDMGGGFIEDLEVIKSEAEKLGVQLEAITHAGNGITFICEADSYVIFREYLTALEESGRFLTPIPPPEGYPFTKRGKIELEPVTGE